MLDGDRQEDVKDMINRIAGINVTLLLKRLGEE